MRNHISVHGATTKYFSNSFVFKKQIEKEGLPRDKTPDLGAGGFSFIHTSNARNAGRTRPDKGRAHRFKPIPAQHTFSVGYRAWSHSFDPQSSPHLSKFIPPTAQRLPERERFSLHSQNHLEPKGTTCLQARIVSWSSRLVKTGGGLLIHPDPFALVEFRLFC
jgi:hypothetical protein